MYVVPAATVTVVVGLGSLRVAPGVEIIQFWKALSVSGVAVNVTTWPSLYWYVPAAGSVVPPTESKIVTVACVCAFALIVKAAAKSNVANRVKATNLLFFLLNNFFYLLKSQMLACSDLEGFAIFSYVIVTVHPQLSPNHIYYIIFKAYF